VSRDDVDPGVDSAPVDAGVGARLRTQLPLLTWLVLVWILLWGTWSWANLLGGLVVALAVVTLLPLPPVESGARVNPVGLLRFVGGFLVDVVRSGALVAWQTVRPRGIGRSAILRVPLRTDSDLLMTIVTEAVCLVPGTIVIDLDRDARELALHVLSADSADDLEAERRAVLRTEERVVHAFGTARDRAALASGEGR
jgi:multicomponent Na+:H+ antiporter subunit E